MSYFSTPLSAAIVCVSFLASTAVGQPLRTVYFQEFLSRRFSSASGQVWDSQAFCPTESNIIARRVLESYGALFAASDAVLLPSVCVFDGEAPVRRYQNQLKRELAQVRIPIAIQAAAARALQASVDEITSSGLQITPLDGSIAGGRTYGDTLMLWNARVFPALSYWSRRSRLSEDELGQFARLELADKIRKILEWEERGIYFSTDRSRSILTSTAPPGASQHLSLLAFDVVEYWNPNIRAILNKNGWYQTVIDDPPHFTYLGYPEAELPFRGLKMVSKAGHFYWVPNLAPGSN